MLRLDVFEASGGVRRIPHAALSFAPGGRSNLEGKAMQAAAPMKPRGLFALFARAFVTTFNP